MFSGEGRFELLLVHFDVDGDLDFVAEHRGSELGDEVEVGALDDGGGFKAADEVALLVLLRGDGAIDVEDDGLGDAGKGEVAFDLYMAGGAGDLGGLEVDRRILGDVEEVRALEVRVAGVHGGVDGGGVEVSDDGGLGGVLFVPLDFAGDLGDGAADVGDAEVANLEVRLRVRGVDGPGAGLGGSDAGDEQGGGGESNQARFHGSPRKRFGSAALPRVAPEGHRRHCIKIDVQTAIWMQKLFGGFCRGCEFAGGVEKLVEGPELGFGEVGEEVAGHGVDLSADLLEEA